MKLRQILAITGLVLTTQAHWASAAPKGNTTKKEEKKPAANCSISIEGTDQMTYQKDGKKLESITVPLSCGTFIVTLKHVGTLKKQVMGHNFVVTTAADKEKVNSAALAQGPSKDYLPDMNIEPFKSKVIATGTKLLSGDPSENAKSEDIKIATKGLKAGGDYTFFCTFPGHFAMMSGKLIVK